MIATFYPSKARGFVSAPPSKSMAHRLLICAGLSRGESLVQNVALSDDIAATLECLRALGADIEISGSDVHISGADREMPMPVADLACRDSGSTLRFLIPVCLLSYRKTILRGSEQLLTRPLGVYEDICRKQGLTFVKTDGSLTVQGPLSGGDFVVAADVSSQFISGLLFALPLLDRESCIRLIPPIESRPYIDMTMQALRIFGVDVSWSAYDTLSIPGGQFYRSACVRVEGDYSAAACFHALNLLGGEVTVDGLDPNSIQGDRSYDVFFEQLKQGAPVIDISDCPDLGPVLMTVAAACHGATLIGTRRLRYKESDRVQAMQEELGKFGVDVETKENSVHVRACPLHAPDRLLDGHNDHRIVMALSVLASRFGGSINGAETVSKSLPDFFDLLRLLNIDVATGGI